MTNDALDLNGVYAVSLHGTSSSKCELVSHGPIQCKQGWPSGRPTYSTQTRQMTLLLRQHWSAEVTQRVLKQLKSVLWVPCLCFPKVQNSCCLTSRKQEVAVLQTQACRVQPPHWMSHLMLQASLSLTQLCKGNPDMWSEQDVPSCVEQAYACFGINSMWYIWYTEDYFRFSKRLFEVP